MGDERHTMMLALDVDPMGGGDWRWRWYDHDSGRTLADGVEGDVVAAWRAATTHHVKSSNELLWSLDDRAEAAEQRAEALAAALAQVRADQAEASGFLTECHKQLDELEGILSDTLAARARAEAEAERLRSAIAETLRLADIYAGVAAHNAEAEPETAGEAWRSPYMATMRELRRALGGAA